MNKGISVIKEVYNDLFEIYGAQGWWPITPIGGCRGKKLLTPIYGIKNHNEKQKLEVVFGSLLAQNTSWKNVEKAIIEMNKKGLIDVNKILKINHDELAQTIRSSGYFNQKAKKLKHIAEFLKKNPIRKLEKMDIIDARELLLNVNGVGKETADSILLYALNKPIFVVDAYTKRIFANLGFIKYTADYDKIKGLFENDLPKDYKLYQEYHALIVEHAKHYYSRGSDFKECPLYKKYAKSGRKKDGIDIRKTQILKPLKT
jgi:endonuclease-3 related protein